MSSASDSKRPAYDDYSDSDDEGSADFENASPVVLGFADGTLPKSQDPESSSTDKIGGFPSFWPVCETQAPDPQAAKCKVCNASMPLLAQINAPLDPEQCEDGALLQEEDRMRVVFVFGCIQKCCSAKENSVRAFRAVRRLAPKPKKEEPKAANPFSMGAAAAASGPFGSNMFDMSSSVRDDGDSIDSDSEDEGPPPASNRWNLPDQPQLPAQYVATEPEPASSSKDAKDIKSFAEAAKQLSLSGGEALASGATAGAEKSSRRGSGGAGSSTKPSGDNWAGEKYERQQLPIGIDEVFFKFEERLMRAGGDVASQIIRYHRPQGQPLPYTANGSAFSTLWRRAAATTEDGSDKRVYDESSVPACAGCGAARTFELQLMPQLVSKLSESGLLKKKEDELELSWASAWVLTCARDCGMPKDDVSLPGETWQEEVVLLQFEDTSEAFKEATAKASGSS